jgi:excisionase family DNA binding protein
MSMNEQRLLTVPEMAERLNVSRSKGWQLAQRGDIPVVRIGRSVRVPEAELAEWIKQHIEGGRS